MVPDHHPVVSRADDRYWLHARRVTGYPRIARDGYFPAHSVTRPAAVTVADLPPADSAAVRAIDECALESRLTSGTWEVPVTDEVLSRWRAVLADVSAEQFWDAKLTTAAGRDALGYDEYVVAVYTPTYFDTDDVFRVRERLRSHHDVTEEICYRPDIYVRKGIDDETAPDWGLEDAARFRQ